MFLSSLQSYVLDVHPFNPRIAMSAGYDGLTIVWDVSSWFCVFMPRHCSSLCLLFNEFFGNLYFQIWEGTPIRIYEIGKFKLVDGKFSA